MEQTTCSVLHMYVKGKFTADAEEIREIKFMLGLYINTLQPLGPLHKPHTTWLTLSYSINTIKHHSFNIFCGIGNVLVFDI